MLDFNLQINENEDITIFSRSTQTFWILFMHSTLRIPDLEAWRRNHYKKCKCLCLRNAIGLMDVVRYCCSVLFNFSNHVHVLFWWQHLKYLKILTAIYNAIHMCINIYVYVCNNIMWNVGPYISKTLFNYLKMQKKKNLYSKENKRMERPPMC